MALLISLTACGKSAPAVSAPVPADAPVSAGFNGTDLAWLQLMVPMTENAVELLRLTPDHGDNPALTAATTKIAESENATLARLRALRDRAGLPASNVHEGHRMPGMVTPADLVVMRDSRGAEFDQRLLALVGAHLDQAGVLARGEQQSGQDGESKSLAAEIARDWAPQREDLTRLGKT